MVPSSPITAAIVVFFIKPGGSKIIIHLFSMTCHCQHGAGSSVAFCYNQKNREPHWLPQVVQKLSVPILSAGMRKKLNSAWPSYSTWKEAIDRNPWAWGSLFSNAASTVEPSPRL